MFKTLKLQNLNKLVKGEIRDFSAPEAFHTLKVQRLGGDGIKPQTQVGRQLVVPISALVGNLFVETCKVPDSTPVVTRPFDLSTDGFVAFSEFIQGVF